MKKYLSKIREIIYKMSKKVASKTTTVKSTSNAINAMSDEAQNVNDDTKINVCEKLNIENDDIEYEGLTAEKCKILFDKLQNTYMKLTNYITELDKVRHQCVLKLTKVQQKYRMLSAKEDMPVQPDIQLEMQKHEDNEENVENVENNEQEEVAPVKKIIKKVVKAAEAPVDVPVAQETKEVKEVKKTIVKARVNKKADDEVVAEAVPVPVAEEAVNDAKKTVIKKKK